MCKSKNIYNKIAEGHIEKILVYCLMRRDYNEFAIEWAKVKTDYSMRENSLLEESEDEDEGLDFEKNISEEVLKGSLEKKRNSMVKFLQRKNCELGNRKASQRTLNIDNQDEEKSSLKIKRGDKVFHVQL